MDPATLDFEDHESEDAAGYEDELEEGDQGFRIHDPVMPPKAYSLTIGELHVMLGDAQINLNPPYQRELVWTSAKQIALIDSLWRNLYIPPVILFDTVDEEGYPIKVCVDGKQRLDSMKKFMDGLIPHKDTKTGKQYFYTQSEVNKKARLNVPDRFKKLFAEKRITCVEYSNITSENERDIFQRVQMGMPLSNAEKMQAKKSPRSDWIGELVATYVPNLKATLRWTDGTTRGKEFVAMANFVHCCQQLPLRSSPTDDKVTKWMVNQDDPDELLQTGVEAALRDMQTIGSSDKLSVGFKKIDKAVAPVEFVFIGVLLFLTRTAPLVDRAKWIYTLRMRIRAKHKDVRTNSGVCGDLWNIIAEFVNDSSKVAEPKSVVKRGTKKRTSDAMKDGGEDDGGEYQPQTKKKTSTGLQTRSKRAKEVYVVDD